MVHNAGGMDMSEHFDGWLERELSQRLNPLTPLSPRPAQARYRTVLLHRRYRMWRLLPATAAAKAVAAVAAVAAAGAVTATAATHSPNPAVWGQRVSEMVEFCKSQAATNGRHGIGDCVSDFASQKRDAHHSETQRPSNSGSVHSTGRP